MAANFTNQNKNYLLWQAGGPADRNGSWPCGNMVAMVSQRLIFFSFCWLERNLLVSVREKYFLNGGMSQACRLYNIFASLHPLEAMNLRCYTWCLKRTFLFIRKTTYACVCTKSTPPATIPVQHTPVWLEQGAMILFPESLWNRR